MSERTRDVEMVPTELALLLDGIALVPVAKSSIARLGKRPPALRPE